MSFLEPQCRVPTYWLVDPSMCWFEWQSLVGGISAVLAAAASVYFLRKQIAQTNELHQQELERRHNAARSVVPMALAAISGFCDAVVTQVVAQIEGRQEDSFDLSFEAAVSGNANRKSFDPVQIPNSVIATMQSFVETLTPKSEVKHVAELLSSVQILEARFSSFKLGDRTSINGLYSILIDSAKVKLLTDCIYNYGRFVEENSFACVFEKTGCDVWDLIHGKAQGLVFSRPMPDIFFPGLSEIISRNKLNQVSPWNERFE